MDLTPIGTKTPDPKPLTRPTDLSKIKVKVHVPEDLESDPSSSDSSSRKTDSSDYRKYRNIRARETIKIRSAGNI